MYWLTGSQQFHLMKNVSESLAGRVGIINLNSFMYSEIVKNKRKELFDPAKLNEYKTMSKIDVNKLYEIIFKGGMPTLYMEKDMSRDIYFNSYLDTYISRDVKELTEIGNELSFRKFIVSVASRTGEQLNYTALANDALISVPTAVRWMSILVTSGLVYLLEPYMNSELKRITHLPKIVFMDTGLAAYLAGYTSARELQLGSSSGHYLETFIVSEIIKAYNARGITPNLYYYRDKEKNEIWSKVALGMESQEIRFPADKGLAGYVVKTGETVNIQDAYTDPRFNPEVDKQTGYKTKNVLCMPIKNNNQEIIGAFQVLNKTRGVFSKSDEDLLEAIGGSASITLENAQLFKQQQELYKEQKLLFESFINTLAASIDARDKITAGHSDRVRLYAMLIVDALGLDEKNKEIIEKAAILHDIGKIGIRDSVLQKEGKLTPEEYKHIQEHVQITHNILEKIYKTEDFKQIDEIACSHHEKYDGTGYFRHLKGEEIPYGGRILAVSDVFDAITSRRHYRDKMPIANVVNILINDSGTHFDKSIVDVFLNNISVDKIVKVFLTENHSSFKPEDQKILEKYKLIDIYNYINKEKPTKKEQQAVDLFNSYYSKHTDNNGDS